MIRVTLLWLSVLGLSFYAWKDWYKSLCGLIILTAFVEHPDMPKTLFGIQGLNPWNLLLSAILLAWLARRKRERLVWDMPRSMRYLMLLYLGLVLVGFVRMMADTRGLEEYTTGYLISEYLINSVKWVIPGLLLFDGCRSRSRFMMGLASLLAVYFLLGVQVIRWMPASVALSGESLSVRSLKILSNEVGYHRVNLSMMLAGASWAIFATRPLTKRRSRILLIIAGSLVVVYAQALTAGRMGYVTWAVVGLVLCLARWRKYLLLAPFIAVAISWTLPGVVERIFEGFSPETRDFSSRINAGALFDSDDGTVDEYTVTAGRNVAWPYVTKKIGESPIFGFGRLAMIRTGLAAFLWEEYEESFPHPHNAYLEILLDSGWAGLLLVLPFYLVILVRGISLFRDSRSPVFVTIGGATSSLVLALLVASIGSQTFYPREGSVGMWSAIGLLLRVSVERSRAVASAPGRAMEPRQRAKIAHPDDDAGPQQRSSGVKAGSRKPGEPVPSLGAIDGMLWGRPV